MVVNDVCCVCDTPCLDYDFDIDGENGVTSFDVTFGYNGTCAATAYGLEPAIVTSGSVAQGDIQYHAFKVSRAALLRVRMPPDDVASSNIDLNLYRISSEGKQVDYSG